MDVACCPSRGVSTRRRRHAAYAIATSALSALATLVNILPVLRDRLQIYLGIDDRGFGLLLAAAPLAGVAGVIIAGILVGRIGPVAMIRRSLQGLAAGMLLLAASGPRWGFALSSCTLCGLCAGALNIATVTYLTRLFPREQRRILALSLAITTGLAGILFPLLAESLLALSARGIDFGSLLHLPFLLAGGLMAGASLNYPSGRARVRKAALAWSWRAFALPSSVVWLALLIALHCATDTALAAWMPRFLGGAAFSQRPFPPGLVLSAFALAYLLARTLLASLPDHWGRRRLMIVPGLDGGSVLLLGLLSRNYVLTAAGYVFGAFLWSAEFPAMLGAAARCSRNQFGMANALYQILGGPLVFAFINSVGWATYRLGEARMLPVMLVLGSGFLLVGVGGAAWVARFGHLLQEKDKR